MRVLTVTLGEHGLVADELPRGAVVAVARLVRCTEVTEEWIERSAAA